MLTFVSLFAGIGGFELGFKQAGMVCKQQVEIDNNCNQVLAYHWPDVHRLEDIKDVGGYNLKTVDLVCGGFPCQDVSVAGRREGLAGERSRLWFEFIRVVVEELRPKWVVVENVPGLLSSNGGRDFATILSGLEKSGYWWAYRILDAQYYGVPQRRRRVFVVGCLTRGRAQEVLFERESSPWDIAPSKEARADVAAPLKASSPSRRGGGSWPVAEEFIVKHALSGHNQRNDPNGEHFVICNALDTHSGGPDDNDAQGNRLIPFDTTQITSHLNRNSPQPGDPCHPLAAGAHPPTVAWNWQSGGDVRHSFGLPNLQAHQVPAVGVRRLTPTECERLQGFPDD